MLLKTIKDWICKLASPNVIPIILLVVSLAYTTTLQKRNKALSYDLANKVNNIEAYEGMLNGTNAKNNVLRLNMEALANSKDSLLHKLDSVKKELKISDKALRTAMIQKSTVHSIEKDTVLLKDSCEFTKVFKPNELTTLRIELKKDSLQYILKLTNEQFLFIHIERSYRNKDKKFFKRLFTWDWKKINYYKYDIINTNSLIEVGSTRIIENIEGE